MQHRSKLVQDINSQVSQLDQLLAAKSDDQGDEWRHLALSLLTHLQDPVHNTIVSWNDWWLSQNAIDHPTVWDTTNNPFHLMKAEVSDIYKAMTKIKMLEKKLEKSPLKSGQTNADWNLLISLKREIGMPVEFPGKQ